jgi:hypothetical protein
LTKHTHNEFSRLIILVNDNDWVLLVDCILMARGSRNLAPCISVKGSIDDHINRVYYNLCHSFAVHGVLEVQLFLDVNLALNGVILDLIVNDVIDDVLVFQTELEAAARACLFWFDLKVASFMKRAGLNVAEVSLFGVSDHLNVLISVSKLKLDLRGDFKQQLLSCSAIEEYMIEDIDLERLNISYF